MAHEIKTMVVGVDFSETGDHALEVALDLAKSLGAKIQLVHVYQIPVYGFPDGAFLAGPEIATRLSQASQKGLDEVLTRSRQGWPGLDITGSLREGSPHEGVIEAAKEALADMIVVGTHGRGLVAHALLGSVSEKIVRTSPVPVLTVRSRKRE